MTGSVPTNIEPSFEPSNHLPSITINDARNHWMVYFTGAYQISEL